jgi:hypothetical protein
MYLVISSSAGGNRAGDFNLGPAGAPLAHGYRMVEQGRKVSGEMLHQEKRSDDPKLCGVSTAIFPLIVRPLFGLVQGWCDYAIDSPLHLFVRPLTL